MALTTSPKVSPGLAARSFACAALEKSKYALAFCLGEPGSFLFCLVVVGALPRFWFSSPSFFCFLFFFLVDAEPVELESSSAVLLERPPACCGDVDDVPRAAPSDAALRRTSLDTEAEARRLRSWRGGGRQKTSEEKKPFLLRLLLLMVAEHTGFSSSARAENISRKRERRICWTMNAPVACNSAIRRSVGVCCSLLSSKGKGSTTHFLACSFLYSSWKNQTLVTHKHSGKHSGKHAELASPYLAETELAASHVFRNGR
jgi:hypothetical protein